jgi:hypothetical protein
LQVVAAYYDPSQADNRIVVGWLLHCVHLRAGDLRHAASFDRTQRANSGRGGRRDWSQKGNAAGIRDNLVAQDKQKLQAALGGDEKVRRYLQ